MKEKIFATIEKYRMLQKGDLVTVACSGGADSLALFHFLLTFRERLGIRVQAAHFNHGLRGKESLRDAQFVEKICLRTGITLYMGATSLQEEPQAKGESVEAWARRLRYDFLDDVATKTKSKVATAHTLNDNAETVLFRAIRGSGPKGLAGIPPVRGPYLRPLLEVTREEVEQYCKVFQLDFMTDSTNQDTSYTRNLLRLEALPILERAHPGAQRPLARLAADMRELDDWLQQEAWSLLLAASMEQNSYFSKNWESDARLFPLSCQSPPGSDRGYDREMLCAAPAPVRIKALAMLAGPAADRAALDRLEQVLFGRARGCQLPGGQMAKLKTGRLIIEKIQTQKNRKKSEPVLPLTEGAFVLPGGYPLTVWIQDGGSLQSGRKKSTKKSLTFAADCDTIWQYGIFRTRRPGDKFAPLGRGVTKTLKKWMNEQKIDPEKRDQWPILAQENGSTVYWVWNAGFCEGAKITPNTKRILWIEQNAGN